MGKILLIIRITCLLTISSNVYAASNSAKQESNLPSLPMVNYEEKENGDAKQSFWQRAKSTFGFGDAQNQQKKEIEKSKEGSQELYPEIDVKKDDFIGSVGDKEVPETIQETLKAFALPEDDFESDSSEEEKLKLKSQEKIDPASAKNTTNNLSKSYRDLKDVKSDSSKLKIEEDNHPELLIPNDKNNVTLDVPEYISPNKNKVLKNKADKKIGAKTSTQKKDTVTNSEIVTGSNDFIVSKRKQPEPEEIVVVEEEAIELDANHALFIEREARVLILPNDDIVLGKESEKYKREEMNYFDYINLFWNKYNFYAREPKREMIDNFLENYNSNFKVKSRR